ncbi:LysR family transcriptional regulator [Labrys wisconsinensis]|uniref:DNA-binding transcriptional LysR family regulator n=1 Tax=Labrys wisconsinensis TaxID=425677 RepID=A0ABU0JDL3_9HYPH|nr:LysR family transcriptional regulator [Labrys wisconsinensis]MDQ0471705.1 DNA-binding transcriptional LysR family regulator [Labrys wisconsinensis]
MDLSALSDFVLVASNGGFGAASRRTGRPKATLSRRVIELEDGLGVRLFERGGRVLRLTEEGSALLVRTEGLLGEIHEAGEAVSAGRDRPRGRLRVSAPILFSHIAMGRIAAAFSTRYPDVQLEVTAEDRPVDLVAEGYDAVIRINPRADDALVGRCFLRDRQIVVATPAHGPPSGQNLGGFPAVVRTNAPAEPLWHVEGFGAPLAPQPVLRLSSQLMVRDAVRAGAGAGLLPQSLVGADVAAGRLTSWGTQHGPPTELWVLHASRRLASAKIRAFVDHLLGAFPEGVLA